MTAVKVGQNVMTNPPKSAEPHPPQVRLQEGAIRGLHCGPYYSFLGVPYAKPPIGNLRFRAPEPVAPWEGTLDTTTEGPECPSRHSLFGFFVGNEDNCLNLNVYTRSLHQGASSPVMMWIHGGSFLSGSNKKELFGPDYLVAEDIVLVCINYRLGVLGFLSLEDSSLGVPGNAGLKDMVLALEWIQRNIQKFGGDPHNVTIFGSGAGAAAVHYLQLSPLSKGLFHRGIAQSGCSLNCWACGLQNNGRIIAEYLGCNLYSEKQILDFLKTVPAKDLVTAQYKNRAAHGLLAGVLDPFRPVVEKPAKNQPCFLKQKPAELITNGDYLHVPLIIGYVANEGSTYNLLLEQSSHVEAFEVNDMHQEFPHELNLDKSTHLYKCIWRMVKNLYFPEGAKITRSAICVFKGDANFVHSIHRAIKLEKSYRTAPIYFYRMSVVTSLNIMRDICTSKIPKVTVTLHKMALKHPCLRSFLRKLAWVVPHYSNIPGACHGDDNFYLFSTDFTGKFKKNTKEALSIDRVVKLWTSFARNGKPTCPELQDWYNVESKADYYLEISDHLEMDLDADNKRMALWDTVYEICDHGEVD